MPDDKKKQNMDQDMSKDEGIQDDQGQKGGQTQGTDMEDLDMNNASSATENITNDEE